LIQPTKARKASFNPLLCFISRVSTFRLWFYYYFLVHYYIVLI